LEEADERVAYVYATLQGARQFLQAAKAPAGGRAAAARGDGVAAATDPAAGPVADAVAGMLPAFVAALRQDLNTPAALGSLSEPLREVNGLLASGKGVDKALRWRTVHRFVEDLRTVADVLGCFGQDPERYLNTRRDFKARRIGLDVGRVEQLVAERLAARRAKDFAAADRLRDELRTLGVSVQDGADGTTWTL